MDPDKLLCMKILVRIAQISKFPCPDYPGRIVCLREICYNELIPCKIMGAHSGGSVADEKDVIAMVQEH
ncbi:hypothetical protein KDW_27060 [Dictyobacter vulcani]|uniref:Uncharacterized protein n=1 Tax=Dictyobacter vulcani TaxID=2607529 RepID=A0A5J4KGG6_9CHLR|nr:hypothetical protein KDW_27060 [Dictyobacter vulcani]